MKINLKKSIISTTAFAALILVSCVPDRVEGDGNGIVPPSGIDAGFTVTETSANHYTLQTKANNYLTSKWNLDDGGGYYNGSDMQKIFLPDAGTYNIKHAAVGQGGIVASISEQKIVVAKSDPKAGNLVNGGKFETAADIANWKVLKISTSGASWTFADGGATINASGSNQQAIYQAIDVVAGTKYNIDMLVSSAGLKNTWFEVVVLDNEPPQGSDISGTTYRNINTWAGCGNSAFNGKISTVGCDGDKNKGIYTATKTGKVYLVIKCGGEIATVKVDNVEFRGVN